MKPLLLILTSPFFIAATCRPTVRDSQGNFATLGGSVFSKSENESAYYKGPLGEMGYASVKKDETVVPKAVISSRTTLGLAGYAKDAFGMGEKTKVALGAQDVTKHGVSTAADVEKLKILNPVEEVAPAVIPGP